MLLKQTTYQHRADFLAAIFGDECAWLCINASHEVMYLYFATKSGPGLAALVPQALDSIPNVLCVVFVQTCHSMPRGDPECLM